MAGTEGIRQRLEEEEAARLAPYACQSRASRGRRYVAEEHDYRTVYQRDRDKIIYSPAFRRLQYKTQVFVNFEGDHYRTRMTHTLEASQIARTIARALAANEDLVEAIVLAHDLGHAPFGHASEEALDNLMRQPPVLQRLAGAPGGFEHNIQSLRIVDLLEGHNPKHPGLNLSWEVREGICKHRFTPGYPDLREFQEHPHPSLEAQIADLADEIAYDCHDVDDGLRAGLLTIDQLRDNKLWCDALARVRGQASDPSDPRYQAVKTLIDRLVTDVIGATAENLREVGANSPDDVRQAPTKVVAFSAEVQEHAKSLKSFLYNNVYYHFQVVRMKEKARRLIEEIFDAYLEQPQQLPSHVQRRIADDHVPMPRAICDYIAGMTDRYAVDERRKLYDIDIRLLP
ncbi:MAG TPA: deoxyguanosinetriphosphate triphosphohydrolase [Chloroflexota bacterium]|nr:deoxyguanosinetriphosphate triphosphohydrolase [Chloroflexota bacterium]